MTDQIQELLTVAARAEGPAVKAGRVPGDRLLRALVPLYLLRNTHGPLALNAGDLHRFWAGRGVKLLPGNARGALWCHLGYARHVARPRPADGWVITPNGIRYVEKAVGLG